MLISYVNWIVRWRFLVIITTLCCVAIAAIGTQYLTFKSDYRMFFSEDNPQLIAFDKLQNTFSKTENVLFVIVPKAAGVFTPQTLDAIVSMTEMAWQVPFANRVDSISNFQHSEAVGDDLAVHDLVDKQLTLTTETVSTIKSIALAEPLLVNRLISADGLATGINVTVRMPENSQNTNVPIIASKARGIVAQIQAKWPHLEIRITGSVMMDNAFGEASEQDGKLLIPMMITLIILLLWLFLRSFTGTLLTTLVIAFSIAIALGIAGWLKIALSPTSVASPNIILTLAVADCVHLLWGFFHRARKGVEKNQAIIESFCSNFKAVLLTSVTTAIGFLSMNFSDAPPFRDLGNITAIGVAAAFLLATTFLLAMMTFIPVRLVKEAADKKPLMDSFVGFLIRRTNSILFTSSILIITLLSFIPSIELNDEFVKYFDKTIDFRNATDFATDNLTGIYYIDFAVDSGRSSGVSHPEYINRLENFTQWLRVQPEVLHVFSITDIIKRLNKNMHGDDPTYYRLPTDKSLTSQYLFLYEMSLPFGLDLNDRIDIDKSSTRLTATLKNLSSQHVLNLENRAQEWIVNHGFDPVTTYATGTTIMFAHIGQRNIQTMLVGTAIALLLISIILLVTLRSIKIGIISLIPNLVPAAMAFGLWGLVVGQVGLAVSVVAAMTLGIVVDDTVHFLSHYLHAKRSLKLNTPNAVHYAFSNVGSALLVTSFVLVAGFSVLALSSFAINASMGALTAIAIVFALIADFLFLPSLLLKVEEFKK
ncbi:MAG: efflux RND transporter permease subunit [Methylococcaceae bacterium]